MPNRQRGYLLLDLQLHHFIFFVGTRRHLHRWHWLGWYFLVLNWSESRICIFRCVTGGGRRSGLTRDLLVRYECTSGDSNWDTRVSCRVPGRRSCNIQSGWWRIQTSDGSRCPPLGYGLRNFCRFRGIDETCQHGDSHQGTHGWKVGTIIFRKLTI